MDVERYAFQGQLITNSDESDQNHMLLSTRLNPGCEPLSDRTWPRWILDPLVND